MEPHRLRAVPIFADLGEDELLKLGEAARVVNLAGGRVLTSQDEYAFKFFVVLSGEASVWQEGDRIGGLGPGDFFGEIGVLNADKRTATVTTESDMELLVFMQWDLRMIEEEWPSVASRIRRELEARLARDEERRRT